MRANRARPTAAAKNIDPRGVGWQAKLGSLSLFSRGVRIPNEDIVALSIERLRNRDEERHMAALDKLGLARGSSHYARSDMVRGGGGEVDTESLYSQVTGMPPWAPVPRKPSQSSQFSDAQRYAESVEGWNELRPEPGPGGNGDLPWLVPAGTGTTQASRNPFLSK